MRSALMGAAFAAATMAGLAAPAHAAVINDAGDDFTVTWTRASSPALSAVAFFDITSITSSAVTMTVTIQNTTALINGLVNAGLASFGIGVTPNATAVSFNDPGDTTGFTNAEVASNPQQNYPGGFKNIDVCVFTDGCNGGAQGAALAAGALDTFTLTISGNFGTTPSVTLDPFPIKFQTNFGSFEFAGVETPGGSPPGGSPGAVPEPASMAIFGMGLAALGFGLRRRRDTV